MNPNEDYIEQYLKEFEKKSETIISKFLRQTKDRKFVEDFEIVLQRDFRQIFILREGYNRVLQTPGEFYRMSASGAGFSTWYLYNSPIHNQVFMMWVTKYGSGCRDDLDRIEIIEDGAVNFITPCNLFFLQETTDVI